jgi:hypothetical protein
MWYIIIGLLVLGIIVSVFQWLSDLVGGAGPLIVIIIIIVVLSVFGLWPYALGFAAICLVGYAIIKVIGKAGKYVGDQVEQHDRSKKETAQINQKTQQDKQIQNNDAALMEELSKNCCWLGYMSEEKWIEKLPNYANRQYSTDFRTITSNFAKQIEQQHILQNNEWFEPFKLYVLNHPGGSTATKMLHEVICPQLKMTHCTPDGDLLNTRLVRGTQKGNKDVPALFESHFIKEMNESVFTPTAYLQKLYGGNAEGSQKDNHVVEYDINDF